MNQVRQIPYLKGLKKRIDWKLLKLEWIQSLLDKKEFLKSYGIRPSNGNVRLATADWDDEVKRLHGIGKINEAEIKGLTENLENAWQTIQEWRKGQAISDWKAADKLKQHANVLMSNSMLKSAKGELRTELSAAQLASISTTLLNVQKSQRLALGMSTENTGALQPPDPNVEKKANNDDEILFPTFVVEVTDNGKFKQARPKQIA